MVEAEESCDAELTVRFHRFAKDALDGVELKPAYAGAGVCELNKSDIFPWMSVGDCLALVRRTNCPAG